MKVWEVASEVYPFSKTGGLGDVCGELPRALDRLGVEVTIVTPLYRRVRTGGFPLTPVRRMTVPVGDQPVIVQIEEGRLPRSNVRVLFVGMDYLFNRDGIYGDRNGDYRDNCSRFALLSRAAMELAKWEDPRPDIFQSHDWQTALVPVYRSTLYAHDFPDSRSVFTIHNLGYQGLFHHWDMPLTGLDWSHFHWRELEFYGWLNLLKGGIVFADKVTTVSPTYAQEIQTPEGGYGLEPVLRSRGRDLVGILNGIDYDEWDPSRDPHLAARFSIEDLAGKAVCKATLQREWDLPEDPNAPLIGVVSRFAKQKGIDILIPAIPELAAEGAQFAILGDGDASYRDALIAMAADHPTIALRAEFEERLAHHVQAGADMIVVPSLYEPCGLTQLHAMRYGTVPVVRSVGGLVDTVHDGTGFRFDGFNVEELVDGMRRAVGAFRERDGWVARMQSGMASDFSWDRSAREYVQLYESIE